MTPQEKLQQLGITLPPVSAPAAAYVPFVRTGNLVFLSGHIARKDGCAWVGKLGDTLDTAEGKLAARAIAIDLMGTLQASMPAARLAWRRFRLARASRSSWSQKWPDAGRQTQKMIPHRSS